MEQITEGLLSLSGWAALAVLFTLPALEAPAFLGLVLPGELVLLLGGVLAAQDRIPLAAALAVGTAGALAGDSAGYWIGRRWGPRLLASAPGRRVGPARLHHVESLLLRGGGRALFVGRCTAGARVVLPGLAGMLRLPYRTFTLWTGTAATLWATAHVLLGFLAGAGWRHIHHLAGRVGLLLALAILIALTITWLLRRRRSLQAGGRRRSRSASSSPGFASARLRPSRRQPRPADPVQSPGQPDADQQVADAEDVAERPGGRNGEHVTEERQPRFGDRRRALEA